MNIVQFDEDKAMNTIVTSREAILKGSRELIQQQGWTAINVRAVAAVCGVSVGSLYNYFNSKSDLIAATVESVWCDIFHFPENQNGFDSFISCVEWAFDCMKKGNEKYPGFFTLHSMRFFGEEKTNGKLLMEQSWNHIQNSLYTVLVNDRHVRPGVFDAVFTPEKFVGIIFSLIISALLQQNYDCSGIREMICRIIY